MVDEGWTTVEKKGPRDMPPRRGEGAAAANGGRGGGGGRGGMGGALPLLENTNYDLRGPSTWVYLPPKHPSRRLLSSPQRALDGRRRGVSYYHTELFHLARSSRATGLSARHRVIVRRRRARGWWWRRRERWERGPRRQRGWRRRRAEMAPSEEQRRRRRRRRAGGEGRRRW